MGFLDDVSKIFKSAKGALESNLAKKERDLAASPQEKLDAALSDIDDPIDDPLAAVRAKIDQKTAMADAKGELSEDAAAQSKNPLAAEAKRSEEISATAGEPIAEGDSADAVNSSGGDASDASEIKAVLFDFGGVVTTSPFEAFARFEEAQGLPADIIRTINSTNPDTNAWAQFERNDVDRARFIELFGAEAKALGHDIDGGAVLDLLKGDIRPEMVDIIKECKARGFKVACLTNNISSGEAGAGAEEVGEMAKVMELFDEIIESSKVGVRKPELKFYEIACEQVGVKPSECVFLDDLGVNLRPARAMGMTTIKVVNAADAIAELKAALPVA